MDDSTGLSALVERAQAGDPAAWDALYRRAYPRLLAYARRRLPTHDAARDAVSDTMAAAVRSVRAYRGEGGAWDAWLSGIIRHVVLDAQRRQSRRRDTVALVAVVPDRAADTAQQPEEVLVRSIEAAAVRAAFDRLTPTDRDVLELRVVMGLSSEEAAGVLGKHPGAVRMAQQRALRRLHALLELQEAFGHG